MAYGSGAGGPDVTRASKDERCQPRFVAESVKNAVELCVEIFVLAVKVREVGKHANLSVDVEGGQHIPAVRTCPITGGTLCELGEVTASYRSPVNLLLLRRRNRTARDSQSNERHYKFELHKLSVE